METKLKTYISFDFRLLLHTTASDPISRYSRCPRCSLSNVMQSPHIRFRSMAKVLCRVTDEEIPQGRILAMLGLPICDLPDVDP